MMPRWFALAVRKAEKGKIPISGNPADAQIGKGAHISHELWSYFYTFQVAPAALLAGCAS
jgi:hypothetical protein